MFAALALLLASVGLYGLLSYSVSVRARDIGIRLALGATPAGVRAMVVRRGMGLVLLGLAIGLVAFGGSSPNDRSSVGRCCGVRLGDPRVGGRLSDSSRTCGVAMAGRPGFAARPRTVTEERIDEPYSCVAGVVFLGRWATVVT